MTNYYTHSVVQPNLPLADIAPLERLVLEEMFEHELVAEEIYFFAYAGAQDFISISRPAFVTAMKVQPDGLLKTFLNDDPSIYIDVNDKLIEIDMSSFGYPGILQDIIKRSATLEYITVEHSFDCDKMRSDGFGGAADFITADKVSGISTLQWLHEQIKSLEKND